MVAGSPQREQQCYRVAEIGRLRTAVLKEQESEVLGLLPDLWLFSLKHTVDPVLRVNTEPRGSGPVAWITQGQSLGASQSIRGQAGSLQS